MNAQVENLLKKPVTEITEQDYMMYLQFKKQGLINLNPYTECMIEKVQQKYSEQSEQKPITKQDVEDIKTKYIDNISLQIFLNEIEYNQNITMSYLQRTFYISYQLAGVLMDYLIQEKIVDNKQGVHNILNKQKLAEVFSV